MALCAYHEDTESVATCVVCKSEICGKCQEFGADGMCGMCLEMSHARKASADASRQARVAAAPAGLAAPGGQPAPARPPAKGAPPARPAGKGATGGLAKPGGPGAKPGGPAAKAPPPGSKPASKAGFCVEHDGPQLTALCTNCRKKVCPYCLDLYDLCVTCRALPHCSRHESMVSAAKCESCNLDYCRLCLDNTPFCDRCRTLGMAKVSAARQGGKPPTGKLDPARAPARPQAPAQAHASPSPGEDPPGPRKAPLTRPGPGQPGYRPPVKSAPLAAPGGKKAGPRGVVYVLSGLLLLGTALYIVFADTRPRLSAEEANAALREEMRMVQAAAIAVQARTGRPPDSVNQLMTQIKDQGVDLKKLNPPLRLMVNAPGTDGLSIILNTTRDGFEVRALDADGRPLAEDGRDVVLTGASEEEGGGDEAGDGDEP